MNKTIWSTTVKSSCSNSKCYMGKIYFYFLFVGFPCTCRLELLTDLGESAFFFFLSFFLFSEVISGEATAGLLTGSEIFVKSLVQGVFSAQGVSSSSSPEESELDSDETTVSEAASVPDESFTGVF